MYAWMYVCMHVWMITSYRLSASLLLKLTNGRTDKEIYVEVAVLLKCNTIHHLSNIARNTNDITKCFDRRYALVYRVFRKNCAFLTIYCNPSLAYIVVRDLQCFQRIASVESLLLAAFFCITNSSRVLARERWQTFENSWKKHNIWWTLCTSYKTT